MHITLPSPLIQCRVPSRLRFLFISFRFCFFGCVKPLTRHALLTIQGYEQMGAYLIQATHLERFNVVE